MGIGSSTLSIVGVDTLKPARRIDAVPDRIVAGTWAFAAVATRGDITGAGCADAAHLEIALDKLAQLRSRGGGTRADGFRVRMADRPKQLRRRHAALPRAADRPPAGRRSPLLAVADGTAMITENLFEARFMFCDEIARMGADVRTDGHHAVVRGP